VKSKIVIAVCLAGLIAVVAVLWALREDSISPPTQEVVTDSGEITPQLVPREADVVARVAEVVDVTSIDANLFPCLVGAVQEAGIPLQSVMEAMSGQSGFEVP